ncbi:xyloside xylosyltransferase 1 [Crotalus tigris]|uniref:xyloside xylosyltransferase 1 n=1 Tax=Crotalus tigris TaxID=88082 RepID=UPI00192F53AC|nr:xyloside xylosyltransferase 1 [Crotalus tigris]
MARRLAVLRAQPCVLAAAAAMALACALYYAGSGPAQPAPPPASPPAPPVPASEGKAKAGEELLLRGAGAAGEGAAGEAELHVLAVLAKAERNEALLAKAAAALRSLVRFGKLGPREALALHLLCDGPSRAPARQLLHQALRPAAFKYKVVFHDLEVLAQKLQPTVEAMQKLFSAGAGSYYGDSLFFLSVAMHHIMPREVSRVIQVDLDVEYRANIRELFQEFDNFPEGAVIGIAQEMQPVYRHIFWQYRQENPGTKVGDPPPDGLPGFNSGVLLLDLEAMRQSEQYNRLLEPAMVQQLANKFHFKGHLGDQDFFTLVGMEHPELFYVLDCTWNRQLCTWWRDHGYSDVFERYFRCDGHVRIYHGNCNTPIPAE